MIELTSSLQLFSELNDIPGEHGDGECHGKSVLHIVASIIIPARKVNLPTKDNTADAYW